MYVPYPVKRLYNFVKDYLALRSIKRWSRFSSEDEFERAVKKRYFLFSREYAILPWGTSIVDYSEPDFDVPMWWDHFASIVREARPEESAVDLGPNQSYLLDALRDRGFKTLSVDYSPGVVVIQKMRGHESIYGNYVVDSLPKLLGERRAFDLITCKGAINIDTIRDLAGFLRTLKESLAAGGLALVTPTNSEFSENGRYAFSLSNYIEKSRKIFLDAGFREIVVEGLNTPKWKFPITLAYGDLERVSHWQEFE